MYQLVIADDHPLYREALAHVVAHYFPTSTLHSAANLNEVFSLLAQQQTIDLLLLDLNMPGMNGLNGVAELLAAYPTLAIAMLSAEDHKQVVLEAMSLGCIGYISKASERAELARAIERILAGDVYMPAESFRSGEANHSHSDQPTIRLAEAASAGNASESDPSISLAELTRQQIRVLRAMVNGAANKQIAYELHISEATVKSHVSAILRKLRVHNRVQAILLAKNANFSAYLTD
ncbi:response regulator [Aliidiomarina sp.]|uniref:response regulator n=1 Tax=Aliidiomarina sp. TaxID=1872439 RepID=UPI003A4D3665